MRSPLLAIVLIAAAGGAHAQAVQDRYDTPMPQAQGVPSPGGALRGMEGAGAKSAAPAKTSYLSWTGKVDALRGAQASADLRGPAMLDTSMGRAVRAAAPPQSVQSQPSRLQLPPPEPQAALAPARAPQAGQIQPALRATQVATANPPPAQAARALPSSLYDAGYAGPANAGGQPAQNRPAQSQQAQPQPALAGAAPAQAQAPAQPLAEGESRPHFYSLVREYGLTPDPIPPAEPSVLSLAPTVAQAMADNKDDGPSIDLAGQDQADANPPERARTYSNGTTSSSSSTTSTNANGQTTSTYVVKQ